MVFFSLLLYVLYGCVVKLQLVMYLAKWMVVPLCCCCDWKSEFTIDRIMFFHFVSKECRDCVGQKAEKHYPTEYFYLTSMPVCCPRNIVEQKLVLCNKIFKFLELGGIQEHPSSFLPFRINTIRHLKLWDLHMPAFSSIWLSRSSILTEQKVQKI